MDITKSNFGASVNEICSLIERASFFSIDLEMSGITSPTFSESPLDPPEQSYLAKRDAAKRYSIIQVGICLFEEHNNNHLGGGGGEGGSGAVGEGGSEELSKPSFLKSSSSSQKRNSSSSNNNLKLVARPFNFFVFPSGAPGGSNDLSAVFPPRDVMISADAASFLRNHGMDWTRWVNSGVSYCNRIEMITAREKLWKRREDEKAAAPRIAKETRALLANDEHRAWLDAALVTAASFADDQKQIGGAECVLPPVRNTAACVALRAAITADPELSSALTVSFRGKRNFHDCLLVRRHTTPEEETSQLVLDAVGFTTVFQKMLSQRRPIVGHNCFADWCFMMESFYEPLPASLSLFKDQMRSVAPSIFDTKILANGGCSTYPDQQSLLPSNMFEHTHLEGLYRSFGGMKTNSVSPLEISLPLGFQNYNLKAGKSGSAHEAGYDALMTGAVFGHFLTRFPTSPLLDNAENKLALFRSMYAVDLASGSRSSSATSVSSSSSSPTSTSSGSLDSSSHVFLPGKHEILHIKHQMGNNSSAIENALRSCVDNVSFFYNLGEGEVLATIGQSPPTAASASGSAVSSESSSSSSSKSSSFEQQISGQTNQQQQNKQQTIQQALQPQHRPKAVTIAQLNERIEKELEREKKFNEMVSKQKQQAQQTSSSSSSSAAVASFTDSAALSVLKQTTRTHTMPPHLHWWFNNNNNNNNINDTKKDSNNSNSSKITAVPAGARTFAPPPPKFSSSMTEFANRDFKSLFRTVARRR